MKAAILFSVIISAFALECPVYQCTDIGQGVCAQKQEGSILLNQNGCSEGQACDISQLYDLTGTPAQSVQCISTSEISPISKPIYYFTTFLQNIEANGTPNYADPVAAPVANPVAAPVAAPVDDTTITAPLDDTTNEPTEVPMPTTTEGGIRRLQENVSVEGVEEEANVSTNTETVEQPELVLFQQFLPFMQLTDQGYELYMPNLGFLSISIIPQIVCQTVPNRNLQEGLYPKACIADADCQLQDGSFATCVCGLDGQSYCQPDYYDDMFSVFTDQCVDGKMNQDVLEAWMIVHQFSVDLTSDPGCAVDIFLQLQNTILIEDQYYQMA